ncbi:YrhB domain-containing protein [Microbulbifer sp. TRSA001]|uniref:YrhB domain-containing protein n=1 Tax=Microbulbifer sp. TRSA001 TaxID=3243381 RepID=UPI00403A22A6
MNKQEALSLVEAELERVKDKYNRIDCVVLAEETIEKAWGWVFFYQSKTYVETGDFRNMLAGNAPIIVNRDTGQLSYAGTAHDIECYIKEYEDAL